MSLPNASTSIALRLTLGEAGPRGADGPGQGVAVRAQRLSLESDQVVALCVHGDIREHARAGRLPVEPGPGRRADQPRKRRDDPDTVPWDRAPRVARPVQRAQAELGALLMRPRARRLLPLVTGRGRWNRGVQPPAGDSVVCVIEIIGVQGRPPHRPVGRLVDRAGPLGLGRASWAMDSCGPEGSRVGPFLAGAQPVVKHWRFLVCVCKPVLRRSGAPDGGGRDGWSGRRRFRTQRGLGFLIRIPDQESLVRGL
jgi:hypothetical protein